MVGPKCRFFMLTHAGFTDSQRWIDQEFDQAFRCDPATGTSTDPGKQR